MTEMMRDYVVCFKANNSNECEFETFELPLAIEPTDREYWTRLDEMVKRKYGKDATMFDCWPKDESIHAA